MVMVTPIECLKSGKNMGVIQVKAAAVKRQGQRMAQVRTNVKM
jgi:hypothetical protein